MIMFGVCVLAGSAVPMTLEVEFKRPTLLPNKLTLSAPTGQEWSKAIGSSTGYTWSVADKKDKPILLGSVKHSAQATTLGSPSSS